MATVDDSVLEIREKMRISGVVILMTGLCFRGLLWAARSKLLSGDSSGDSKFTMEIQVVAMSLMQFFLFFIFGIFIYGMYAGQEGLPLFLGGGPGLYALGAGLLRTSVCVQLILSMCLAWCFDLLSSMIVVAVGGVWGAVLTYVRSVPFFILGCYIFSEAFTGWQFVGLIATLEGIFV